MLTHATRRANTRGRMPNGAANPIDVHVGARIRLRRTLLGISQDQLGGSMGLTFQQVQKYERGANRVSASRLFDLSEILDVPVAFFFDDMPAAIRASAPARIHNGHIPQPIAATTDDPLVRRETMEVARLYAGIKNPLIRAQMRKLLSTVIDQSSPAAA